MAVHWLSFSFVFSLPAVHFSTACSSPAPPAGACLQRLPVVHPAPCGEAGCTRCPPRHAHRVHPYSNIIIYVKIYKLFCSMLQWWWFARGVRVPREDLEDKPRLALHLHTQASQRENEAPAQKRGCCACHSTRCIESGMRQS